MLKCIPASWHRKHCPDEANDTPDNLEQQWWKDIKLSLTVSPSQEVVLKQTGAVKCINHVKNH